MKLYAIIDTRPNTGQTSVPYACDDKTIAVDKMKQLIADEWDRVSKGTHAFPWFRAMLDDIVDNKKDCSVTLQADGSNYGILRVGESIQIKKDGVPFVVWNIVKTENVELGLTTMYDISEEYEYRTIRTSVECAVTNRFPGADVESGPVKDLIDGLADIAHEFVKTGCEEDWSIDKAFQQKADEVAAVLDD